ncbi:hypothetical protein SMICM17S_10727 [Streptomyces microflavus]
MGGGGVVDHECVQLFETGRAGMGDGLVIAALVQLGIADQHPHPGVGEPLGPQPEDGPDGQR